MQEQHLCKRHGAVTHHRIKDKQAKHGFRWRCKSCMNDAVKKRKQKIKQTLIEEAGGKCQHCGFRSKGTRAMTFHHADPLLKNHTLDMGQGKSLDRFRLEARACVLLCANCHAELEDGKIIVRLPRSVTEELKRLGSALYTEIRFDV